MIRIFSNQKKIFGEIKLEASKSISNRLLIIKNLTNLDFKIHNLSNANDTQVLLKVLSNFENKEIINCEDAGTALRFIIPFLASKKGKWEIFGTKRMHQRPVGPLVESLKQLGCHISYLEKEGFPPVCISSNGLVGGSLSIKGDVSSQYISALLLVAPTLKKGLNITISSVLNSAPYVKMTLELMKSFGVNYNWDNNRIEVKEQEYVLRSSTVENDWSAASFWYSFIALSKEGSIKIPQLYKNSIQGDAILSDLYTSFGVNTEFNENGVLLRKSIKVAKEVNLNLSNHPDLALPIVVTCAGLGIKGQLNGLESLKIKESDRLFSIKKELNKFNVSVEIDDSSIKIKENQKIVKPTSIVECHNDHRIAMSIAPLCMKVDSIKFDDKDVVNKSYPKFWEDFNNITN